VAKNPLKFASIWALIFQALRIRRDHGKKVLFCARALTAHFPTDAHATPAWKNVEQAFRSKNDRELMQGLLKLELFPIKDSYIPFLRRDKTAIDRNPETVRRICGRLYEMGLEKISDSSDT
jgi:hypothetical protein